MTNRDEFVQAFAGHTLPRELTALLDFERDELTGNVYYADGFELACDSDKGGLRTYSESPQFLAALLPFAQADGTGSEYAFWLGADLSQPLSQVPIVVFGSEGGHHVVAANIGELLQILTYDVEPMVDWDGVTYYKDDGKEPSEGSAIYQSWLSREFSLDPVSDAAAIVSRAQRKHGKAFASWMEEFLTPA